MPSPFEYAPAPESRAVVDIASSYGLFIDGEFVDGTGTTIKSINPATEEVLSEVTVATIDPSTALALADVAEAGPADVDAAVAAARSAYDTVWRDLPGASVRPRTR